tara:strand:- start:2808 stop:3659 length:852 start_codon:yes stop_codon:yes gene_type:complete
MKEYFVGTDDFQRAHELTDMDEDICQGAMISANALRGRKSPLNVGRWMLDSGAFSQVTQYGDFTMSPKEYVELAVRFQDCGDLACIVTQDYMCEPQVIAHLKSMGIQASWRLHQRKTVDRYKQILVEGDRQGLKVPIMPVLQGWEVEDYMEHWALYVGVNRALDRKSRNVYLPHGYNHDQPQWLGLGSTCKRNAKPTVVSQILDTLPWDYVNEQDDFRIHAFGLKTTALKHGLIKDRLYSSDSFAYDFHARISGQIRTRRARMDSAVRWGKEIRKNQVQMELV